MKDLSLHSIAKMIDHSLLHPTLTDDTIIAGCLLARKHGVASSCVKPYAVPMAKRTLEDSGVAVCAVIAFPHGNSVGTMKVLEAEEAIRDGATEIDMVVNIGKVLGGDWAYVTEEIRVVNDVVTQRSAALKVIFENDYLQEPQIVHLCETCSALKVAFVKTSTGYGFVRQPNGSYSYRGATDQHVRLMRQHCSPKVKIKAAGGIRTLDDLLRFRALGVDRIGATATKDILEEAIRRGYN